MMTTTASTTARTGFLWIRTSGDDDGDRIGKNADSFEVSPGMKGAAFTLSSIDTAAIELTIIGAMGSEGHVHPHRQGRGVMAKHQQL